MEPEQVSTDDTPTPEEIAIMQVSLRVRSAAIDRLESYITELEQERDRLRLALERIRDWYDLRWEEYAKKYGVHPAKAPLFMPNDIARAALRKDHEPVSKEFTLLGMVESSDTHVLWVCRCGSQAPMTTDICAQCGVKRPFKYRNLSEPVKQEAG